MFSGTLIMALSARIICRQSVNNNTVFSTGGIRGCLLQQWSTSRSFATDYIGPDLEKRKKPSKRFANFIDSLRLYVKGGMGGQGLPQRGGAGGRGGDIVVVGSKKEGLSLKDVTKACPKKRVSANTGMDSKFFCLYGENAKPVEIKVPLGITIISESGVKMGEINRVGDKVVIAKGGMGGCAGNGFSAEKGQAHTVTLDLKLIADIGFLGFPNAGKSTLLKAISNATPKIASYPFTTMTPNIGIVEFPDLRRISLADLPGLIEGAHANQGMGHKFLKHVERTKLLLFIVDLHGFQLSPHHSHRSALETIVLLNKELELYQPDLTEKPAIVALNKMDKPNSYSIIKKVQETLTDDKLYAEFLDTLPPSFRPEYPVKFEHILPISAAKDVISVGNLKNILRRQLDVEQLNVELHESRLSSSILVK